MSLNLLCSHSLPPKLYELLQSNVIPPTLMSCQQKSLFPWPYDSCHSHQGVLALVWSVGCPTGLHLSSNQLFRVYFVGQSMAHLCAKFLEDLATTRIWLPHCDQASGWEQPKEHVHFQFDNTYTVTFKHAYSSIFLELTWICF